MKVKQETKDYFEPVTIEITIESEDELKDLWHRTNSAHRCFYESDLCDSIDLGYPKLKSSADFWKLLNNICKQKGLI